MAFIAGEQRGGRDDSTTPFPIPGQSWTLHTMVYSHWEPSRTLGIGLGLICPSSPSLEKGLSFGGPFLPHPIPFGPLQCDPATALGVCPSPCKVVGESQWPAGNGHEAAACPAKSSIPRPHSMPPASDWGCPGHGEQVPAPFPQCVEGPIWWTSHSVATEAAPKQCLGMGWAPSKKAPCGLMGNGGWFCQWYPVGAMV